MIYLTKTTDSFSYYPKTQTITWTYRRKRYEKSKIVRRHNLFGAIKSYPTLQDVPTNLLIRAFQEAKAFRRQYFHDREWSFELEQELNRRRIFSIAEIAQMRKAAV